jgi:hypothetical protein
MAARELQTGMSMCVQEAAPRMPSRQWDSRRVDSPGVHRDRAKTAAMEFDSRLAWLRAAHRPPPLRAWARGGLAAAPVTQRACCSWSANTWLAAGVARAMGVARRRGLALVDVGPVEPWREAGLLLDCARLLAELAGSRWPLPRRPIEIRDSRRDTACEANHPACPCANKLQTTATAESRAGPWLCAASTAPSPSHPRMPCCRDARAGMNVRSRDAAIEPIPRLP